MCGLAVIVCGLSENDFEVKLTMHEYTKECVGRRRHKKGVSIGI